MLNPYARALISSAALLALCLPARPALAQAYVAADYNSVAEPGRRVSGFDAGLGYRTSEYLGFEAGYEGVYSNLPFSGGYLVAIGYLPFGATGFEAFGDVGGLVLTADTTRISDSPRRWASGYRADAGLEYDLSPYWTVRVAYRYQSPLASMHAYVAGLKFSF